MALDKMEVAVVQTATSQISRIITSDLQPMISKIGSLGSNLADVWGSNRSTMVQGYVNKMAEDVAKMNDSINNVQMSITNFATNVKSADESASISG